MLCNIGHIYPRIPSYARAGVFVLAQVCLFFTHGARSALHVGNIGRNHPRAISALHCTLLVIGAAASSYFCYQLCYSPDRRVCSCRDSFIYS